MTSPGRRTSATLLRFDQRGTGAGALRCRDLEAATATDAGREAGGVRRHCSASGAASSARATRWRTSRRCAWSWASSGWRSSVRATAAYVAQRYAMRYPDHVEKLLLLSPVDAAGLDPLYGDSMAAVRRILPALCRPGCRSFTSDVLADTARLVERLAREPLRGTIVGPKRARGARPRSPARSCCSRSWRAMTPSCRSPTTRRRWCPRCAATRHRSCARSGVRSRHRRASPSSPREPRRLRGHALRGGPVPLVMARHARPSATRRRFSTETAMDPSLAAPFDPGTLVRSDLMRLCRRWPTASPSPPPEPGPMPDVPVLVLAAPDERRVLARERPAHRGAVPRRKAARDARVGSRSFGFPAQRLRRQRGPALPRRAARAGPLPPRCRAVLPPARPAPESLSDLQPAGGVPGRPGRLLRAFGVTFGDLVDSFYVDALPEHRARRTSTSGLRGGGLRGGNFAITEARLPSQPLRVRARACACRAAGAPTATGSGRCTSTAPARLTASSGSGRTRT